ncbi:TPA: hypothetical protein RI347_000866 [Escherichia coli]|uniref:hypothetical protein n=1 Tax=Enterobacteriaceae TaxID=543 RepID=UPI0025763240|nr:hypothetical protein [Citrobacter sp. Cb130]MDM3328909.1 hypothetical protein [Citrobacter sp. Cb130]HDV5093674.1 hypothetical protein [Escherichia coli]
MSTTYAVIENGMVVNVIIWDGVTSIGFGGDQLTIQIAQSGVGTSAPIPGIGWSYENGVFTPPPSPPLTPESMAAKNLALAQAAYNVATAKITALNEQIADADYAGTTEDEVNDELTAWTDYRKQLRAYIKTGDGNLALPVVQAV